MGIFSIVRQMVSSRGRGAGLSLFRTDGPVAKHVSVERMLALDVDPSDLQLQVQHENDLRTSEWLNNYPSEVCQPYLRATCTRMYE
mmetsp:Transcript_51439/g.75257  ORF Transcript_51439/g.75257 Transcript_51439/m.75257 type:complete len:86 (-) Transcript_51439:740-997(-)